MNGDVWGNSHFPEVKTIIIPKAAETLNTDTQNHNIGSKYLKQAESITFLHSTVEYSKIQLRMAKFRA